MNDPMVVGVPQIAQRIADWAKRGGGRDLEPSGVQAILEPWLREAKSNLDQACRTMHALSKGEGDWRFSLGDGLIAVVNFSGPVKKQHLAAFVKVFATMAEAYLEAATPCEPEHTPVRNVEKSERKKDL